ncbi:hypothetical protein QBZ16_000838 [Prototheca wickerhamii]|uniref:Uncharacterized protein n=1 Tax=Prototheca wickerhamii TaxID=3111 RepID=A0AAD9IFS4_PROWI|nr:hypothetical protein QBZ16_000838 [Prototheca wickerhamii]
MTEVPLRTRPPAAYPTHVPLSGLQKGALAVLSAAGAALRPQRADLVATVGETSAGPALAAIKRRMLRDPEGRRVLEDRPRVREDLLASARRAPPNSFGAAYAAFMDGRGFSPDERPPALEFVQTGLPMTGLAVVAGELRLAAPLRKELNSVFLPWALQAGSHAADLMCIYYEQHLEDDLEEMRRRYRIITAPVPTQGVTYASHQGKLGSLPGGAAA